MNTPQALTQVILPVLLLWGIVAAIAVRCIGAVCSGRIRESVRRHPVAHVLWLVGGLVVVLVLLAWLSPHFSNRRARAANQARQPTPVERLFADSGRAAWRGCAYR